MDDDDGIAFDVVGLVVAIAAALAIAAVWMGTA